MHDETLLLFVKFIYSEKATKFCEISTLDLSYVVTVKSSVEILQNFVAFSEYMNFTNIQILFVTRNATVVKTFQQRGSFSLGFCFGSRAIAKAQRKIRSLLKSL